MFLRFQHQTAAVERMPTFFLSDFSLSKENGRLIFLRVQHRGTAALVS